MRDKCATAYNQIRNTSRSNIRIRTTPSPERQSFRNRFTYKPMMSSCCASTKATVILPLQNEYIYTMPQTRKGCRAIEISNKLGIVLGGSSIRESYEINYIDLQSGQWLPKQQNYEKLQKIQKENEHLRLGSHFSLNYDEIDLCFYLFGGERTSGVRRSSNSLVKIQEQEMTYYTVTSISPRRNHTATYIDKSLIIIGGFEDMNTIPIYYGDIHSINLITMRSQQLKPIFKNGIAYHCAVKITDNNYIESSIYIFGGKNKDDIYYQDMFQLQIQDQILQSVPTLGIPPKSRRSFSMNYDIEYQTIIIYGGTDDIEIFDDLWLFTLSNSTFCRVQLSGYMQFTPRYDHCSLYHTEKLLIFGGLNEFGYILFNPIQITLKLKKSKNVS